MLIYEGNVEGYRPEYATLFSVGVDLINSGEDVIIGSIPVIVDTGVKISKDAVKAYPFGYIRIAPKSSKALAGLQVLAGVVDLDYPDTIKVILINYTSPIKIAKGDKIAQAIFERAKRMPGVPVKQASRTGGFGSTDGKDQTK